MIARAGTIGQNARANLENGIDSYTSILGGPCTLAEAIQGPSKMLIDTAEQVMRTVLVGRGLTLLES